MRLSIAIPAALLAAPATLHAQSGGDLIVTATRAPAPLERLPYAAIEIGATDLAASESLADALARLPQVHVQMPGGRTGFASLFLRGADPNFTTVLLEGVPLDSPTNSRGGAVNLAAIPSAAIDRAELVAGPVSTLYGSGPLAGALNLLLAPPTPEQQLTAGGSLGSEGEMAGFARWQGPLIGGLGGSLTGTIDDAGRGEPESRFRSRGLDLKLARLDGGRGSLLVHLAGTMSRGFPDASGGFEQAAIRVTERRESDALVLAVDLPLVRAGALSFGLAGSWSDRGDRVVTPGVAPSAVSPTGVPAGSDDIRYTHGIVRPDLRVDLGPWTVFVGAQGQWEKARSRGFLDFGFPVPANFDQSRTSWSGFGEASGSAGQVTANAGLRFDDIEDIGRRLTGRAGLRWALDSRLSVRGSVASGFKAPSFYALGNPFIGNLNLRPESVFSVELGLDWRPAPQTRVAVALFSSRYRDLIDFVPSDLPRLENRSRVTARGLSLDVAAPLAPRLRVNAGAQYVETVDAATGGQLLYRPRWRASAALDWAATPRLDLTLRHAFTGARDDYALPAGIESLLATHRLSASAVWRIDSATRLRLDAENLLDERGQDAIGFPVLPRRIKMGLSRRLF